jgi:hypothetical protein
MDVIARVQRLQMHVFECVLSISSVSFHWRGSSQQPWLRVLQTPSTFIIIQTNYYLLFMKISHHNIARYVLKSRHKSQAASCLVFEYFRHPRDWISPKERERYTFDCLITRNPGVGALCFQSLSGRCTTFSVSMDQMFRGVSNTVFPARRPGSWLESLRGSLRGGRRGDRLLVLFLR